MGPHRGTQLGLELEASGNILTETNDSSSQVCIPAKLRLRCKTTGKKVCGSGTATLAVLTLAFCDGGYSRTTISFYSTSAPDMNASTA